MNLMIFGAGTIGSELVRRLLDSDSKILCIVRSTGIFDSLGHKLSEQSEWRNFVGDADAAFICIPTIGTGKDALEYELAFLEQGKRVISCEKASIAHHWEKLRVHKNIFKYTASVGGGTKMLKEVAKYAPSEIKEIKAVINGTLNYISDGLRKGATLEEITKEVIEKGYAEPGAASFEEVIKAEMNDVILKAIIIANSSNIFDRVIEKKDIEVVGFDSTKRCIAEISRDIIRIGFIEDTNASWLPTGVNNVLYINGEMKVMGPGAGAIATVNSIQDDFESSL
jgi:homoserine dehydrogenase